MRIKNIACIATALLVSLSGLKAATTALTAWAFDNLSTGTNASPQPSTGLGSASALGMANSYNNTNSLSAPIIISLPGSSSGGPNSWQISGGGAAPNGGDGWSTNAPIGTQGAQFSGGTAGFYRIMVTFDVNATPDAEANLQVQYTTQGTIWNTATNIISGGAAVVMNNSSSPNTVNGTYVQLASGWNNQITVDLSGISGVDNNPNFAIRLVNASTGPDCVNTSETIYNDTSGSWSFDNVVIQGVSIDTISEWTFASYGTGGIYASNSGYVENPIPELNFGTAASAACIGFNTDYNFAGTIGSSNAPDVTAQAGSSTPNNTYCWRVRGAPGNGWDTQSPIGTQGGEFDVSTLNYTNVVLSFDIYFTSQGEAKMCVLYTTNGWTTSSTANSLFYAANPTFIQTNDPVIFPFTYSSDTVTGTYFYETTGQNFYNDLVVDFTGIPNVANNPLFGIRIVNAATGGDCVAYNGGSYNNSSGNCRFANVNFGGQYSGLIPPTVTNAPNATVDNAFTNTFTDNPNWRANITAVYVNGTILTNGYTTNTPGMIIFTPSLDSVLQVAGIDSIVIYANGYSTVRETQPINAGAFKNLNVVFQPLGPSASGGTLEVNPMLGLFDQYGNTTTNPYANVVITATNGSAGWTLGGATVQSEVNGLITFTNLSASVNGSSAVNGAVINLIVSGYTNAANQSTTTNINLASFNIGAPPVPFTPGNLAVFQIDTVSNNTTFSMIEVRPSIASQTTAINIVPISATGTNALREAPSGTPGRLCLSDDGTLLCFAAFVDGSAATPDETLNLNRAAVGVNYTNGVTLGSTYLSDSLGGSQARAAATIDDVNYFTDDKGGIYYGGGYQSYPNLSSLNNVVVKTFGGVPYAETQKTANGSPIPVVYSFANVGGNPPWSPQPNNLGTDPVASDFYLISTNCGSTYDIMYTVDQVSSSVGVINKFSWVNGANPGTGGYGWATNGTWTNSTGVDGLFVATNGTGGAYLFYTTGAGGTAGNTIIRLTDSAGWNQAMNITSSNLIYTAAKTVSIKGLTFVPQRVPYTNQFMPPPILAAQTGASAGSSFNVTTTPDDTEWRDTITAITVNGTNLPAAAYSTNSAGKITFNPANSGGLLQTTAKLNIAIIAPGYSTNTLSLSLASGSAAQLSVSTQPTAPAADGGILARQPVVKVEDQYGDLLTTATNIVASATQNTWTLAGVLTNTASSGTGTYTNLAAFSANAVSGATITFSCGSLTPAVSSAFNIPAPVYAMIHGIKNASGKLSFSFTNSTGLSYSVLATNKINAPLPWPVAGTVTESPAGSGIYNFTNSIGANAQLFYILRQNP